MLAWPAMALLKKQYPAARIVSLVPEYTQPMAELCPSIDEVIIDDRRTSGFRGTARLSRRIRKARVDASISLYSESRTALALWLAGVPRRFGPATKLAQIFLNNRLLQKRSRSAKPEHEYNTDLARYFIHSNGETPVSMPEPPYLSFNADEIRRLKQQYYRQQNINDARKLVFIHPGTGGSAINLSLDQYAQLASRLAESEQMHFVLTAGPGELEVAKALSGMLANIDHSLYHSTQGLVSFSRYIAQCDLFISGSTGPLHIAGALDVPTAAFYPARKSATPLRWQTLNRRERRLSFSPEKYTGEDDMKTIDPEACAASIARFVRQL